MTRKEIVISGKDKKLHFNILIGGVLLATIRGENFIDIGDFYFIKQGNTHQSIEKIKGLVIRDYRITD